MVVAITAEETKWSLIEWKKIHPNTWNEERASAKDPETIALAKNIGEKGLLQPIQLRPHPSKAGEYEIIFGERRWVAMGILKREAVPSMVKGMGDQDAMELTMAENFLRKPLSPWQEAQTFQIYLGKGFDIAGIHAQTGRAESLIRRRVFLLDLTPKWQKIIEGNDARFEGWTARHFENIARRPAHVQDELLVNQFKHHAPNSLARLESELADQMDSLTNAPWKLADPLLDAKAGSCNACPKRSGAQADMFSEVQGKAKKEDRCLDGGCFARKLKAFTDAAVKEAKAETGKPVLQFADTYYNTPKGAVGTNKFERAKESDKKAQPAVVVEGKDLGKTIWIKPIDNGHASGGGVKSSSAKTGPMSMKEKRAALEKRRHVHLFGVVKLALEKGKYPRKPPASEVLRLAAVIGTRSRAEYIRGEWKTIEALAAKPQADQVAALWKQVADVLAARVKDAGNNADKKTSIQEVQTILILIGLSWDTLKAEADKEIPVPKSWGETPANASSAEPAGDDEDENDDDYQDH